MRTRAWFKLAWLVSATVVSAVVAEGANRAVGTASGAGVSLGGSTRSLAMGGAGMAVLEEPAAIWLNPAQIARLNTYALSLMHGIWVEDVLLDQVAVAIPAPVGRFGGALTYLRVQDIEMFDATGRSTGTFTPSDLTATGAYAMVSGPLVFGVAGKYVQSELASGVKATAVAADAGVSFTPMPNLTFAAAGLHLGSTLKYDRVGARLPATVRGGVAYLLPGSHVALVTDLVKPIDGDVIAHLGVEEGVSFHRTLGLDLRAGWHTGAPRGSLSGASAGCGVNWVPEAGLDEPGVVSGSGSPFGASRAYPIKGVSVDYAWTPMGELGVAHWFSLLLSF
jgi:hypothetical protein